MILGLVPGYETTASTSSQRTPVRFHQFYLSGNGYFGSDAHCWNQGKRIGVGYASFIEKGGDFIHRFILSDLLLLVVFLTRHGRML
jgi:hypothetical protein